jgi:hypothetical protein
VTPDEIEQRRKEVALETKQVIVAENKRRRSIQRNLKRLGAPMDSKVEEAFLLDDVFAIREYAGRLGWACIEDGSWKIFTFRCPLDPTNILEHVSYGRAAAFDFLRGIEYGRLSTRYNGQPRKSLSNGDAHAQGN